MLLTLLLSNIKQHIQSYSIHRICRSILVAKDHNFRNPSNIGIGKRLCYTNCRFFFDSGLFTSTTVEEYTYYKQYFFIKVEFMYRKWDSNSHGPFRPQDFKSGGSTNSPIAASLFVSYKSTRLFLIFQIKVH